MICGHCKEIIDQKCEFTDCNLYGGYKYYNEHMLSQCNRQTYCDPGYFFQCQIVDFCRSSKHVQHLLNYFFKTSFQIAVLFSYDFIINTTRNVQDFYDMMINYSKELRKNQWINQEYVNYLSDRQKDPPYLILFKLMTSCGIFNGFDIGLVILFYFLLHKKKL